MQLETMFPGPDGEEFIRHLTEGSLAKVKLAIAHDQDCARAL